MLNTFTPQDQQEEMIQFLNGISPSLNQEVKDYIFGIMFKNNETILELTVNKNDEYK